MRWIEQAKMILLLALSGWLLVLSTAAVVPTVHARFCGCPSSHELGDACPHGSCGHSHGEEHSHENPDEAPNDQHPLSLHHVCSIELFLHGFTCDLAAVQLAHIYDVIAHLAIAQLREREYEHTDRPCARGPPVVV